MKFEDRVINCIMCSLNFVFTASEQEFFQSKGLQNEPKRCSNCRIALRSRRQPAIYGQITDTECADCGGAVKIPFKPDGHKPIYCFTCLHKLRKMQYSDEIKITG